MEQNLLNRYNETNAFGRDNEMTFTVLESGKVEYLFTPQERHLATQTAVHGGAIAAFMDAVISVAALSSVYTEGKMVATVEFKLNFIAPAFPNQPLKGIGQVVSKGKTMLVSKGDIFDNQGKLLATGIGTIKAYTVNI